MVTEYADAIACTKGHWITTDTETEASDFCALCGSAGVARCEKCNTYLRGDALGDYVIVPFAPPAFCHHCGHAWPWTQARTAALIEFAEVIEELTAAEVDNLKELLPHIITDGPRTQVAGFKIASLVSKAKPETATLLREILASVAVESAKGALGLPKSL